jgi:integrase/recombinase XerD
VNLKQLIEQYVTFRQALGDRFKAQATVLRSFGRAVGADTDISDVGLEQVNPFLWGVGPVTSFWHAKYTVLRGLYRYAICRGHATVLPLPDTVPKRPPPFVPYIYSREELRRLLGATEKGQHPLRRFGPLTLRTVILLLYGAGLRVSEALNLDCGDVDLDSSLITIRDSKFFKSRLVPVGPQLAQTLKRYTHWRQANHATDDPKAPFFVGRDGKRLGHRRLSVAFRQACIRAGIRRPDKVRFQPRMHDLRHTFAVHRLTEWYRQGADVQKLLPQLSVYLGHCCLSSTQAYLNMTPELLQQAGDRFERYARQEDDHE